MNYRKITSHALAPQALLEVEVMGKCFRKLQNSLEKCTSMSRARISDNRSTFRTLLKRVFEPDRIQTLNCGCFDKLSRRLLCVYVYVLEILRKSQLRCRKFCTSQCVYVSSSQCLVLSGSGIYRYLSNSIVITPGDCTNP